MKKKLFLLIFAISFSMISCKLELPIKEMNSAKMGIKRSYQVKADKYDPENLKNAEAFLISSHDYLKKEDAKKAKEEAVNSSKASETAINNSLPKLAQDSLDEAIKANDDLNNLNPGLFAADEYKTGLDSLKNAEELNNSKKYWESHIESQKAVSEFIKAKNLCLATLPTLAEKHKNLTAKKNELESSKWAEEGKDDLADADKFLLAAYADLDSVNLKSASANLTEAENKINAANEKITRISAKESIAVMRDEIKILSQNRGNEFAKQELANATVSLDDADGLLTSNDYSNASIKIQEAEKDLFTARDKINKGTALERIKSVENFLSKVKLKDTERKFTQDFDDAEFILNESKKHFEEGALEISMSKADESEALLNSILIALEKDSGAIVSKENSDKISANEQIYIVKYRKKNTDCLWRISLNVYKNARLWPLIYKANKDQIKDPDLIFPGQRFIIPPIPGKKIIKEEDKAAINKINEPAQDETVKPEEKRSEAPYESSDKEDTANSKTEETDKPEAK